MPIYEGDDRRLLERWLDFHRATLVMKCEGLSDEQRKARLIPTSLLSLHGLVRHLAEAERTWFRRVLPRDPELPRIWPDPPVEGRPFVPLEDAKWEDDLEAWRQESQACRIAAAAHGLDDTGIWRDEEVSLRSIYNHMIQEYARHNGHADLIRELLDGTVGF